MEEDLLKRLDDIKEHLEILEKKYHRIESLLMLIIGIALVILLT